MGDRAMNAIKKSALGCAFLGVLAFAATANAGTINVFAQYLGTTSYSAPLAALQDRYAKFLSQGNLDFGVFYGPSSAADFGFTHSDYTKPP